MASTTTTTTTTTPSLSTPPTPLQKGNLSCEVINDKLYFKFELPFAFQRNILSNFSLFHCENFMGNTQFPPTNYINNGGAEKTISALVGEYDSNVLLRPLCLKIQQDGKRTMQMQDFKVKSTQRPIGRAWNIFDQFDCFDRRAQRGGGEEQHNSVRHLGVEAECTNMTVTWVNDKFDEFWFVRTQRVSIAEIFVLKTTVKTNKALAVNRTKSHKKYQRQHSQQHPQQQQYPQTPYYHESEINSEATTNNNNHRYEKRDLKPNTEYRVCIITEYGAPNGSKRKCSTVYNFCWRRNSNHEKRFEQLSSTESDVHATAAVKLDNDQSLWIKITAILSSVSITGFIGVFLLVIGVRRGLCGYHSRDNGGSLDLLNNGEVSARPPDAGCFVDELDLVRPLEYHQYYEIES